MVWQISLEKPDNSDILYSLYLYIIFPISRTNGAFQTQSTPSPSLNMYFLYGQIPKKYMILTYIHRLVDAIMLSDAQVCSMNIVIIL